MRRWLILILLLIVSPSALAQEVDPLAGLSREQLVVLLDDADFEVREDAERRLIADDTLDQPALRELLLGAQSDEQRHRLIRVAEHHVLRFFRQRDFGAHTLPAVDGGVVIRPQPRGSASIGYTYDTLTADQNPLANRPGIYVAATMPGFPANQHLRPGDVIISIGSRPVPVSQDAAGVINWINFVIGSYQPGDTMTMSVMRGSQTLNLAITCAQRAALEQMYTSDAFKAPVLAETYDRQWQTALEQLTQGLPQRPVLTLAP